MRLKRKPVLHLLSLEKIWVSFIGVPPICCSTDVLFYRYAVLSVCCSIGMLFYRYVVLPICCDSDIWLSAKRELGCYSRNYNPESYLFGYVSKIVSGILPVTAFNAVR